MGRVPVLSGLAEYKELYERSLAQPADFWADMAQRLGLHFHQKVLSGASATHILSKALQHLGQALHAPVLPGRGLACGCHLKPFVEVGVLAA